MAWGATPPSHSQLFAMIMPAAVAEGSILRDEAGGEEVYAELDNAQSVEGLELSDVLVGQQVNLKTHLNLAPGVTVEDYSWEIAGETFKSYVVIEKNLSDVEHRATLKLLEEDDLDEDSVTFYWSEGGRHEVTVTVDLSVGDDLVLRGNFDVDKPAANLEVVGLGEARYEASKKGVGLFWDSQTNLPAADNEPAFPGPSGIVWRAKVEQPEGWPANEGRWHFVQTVTTDRHIDTGQLGQPAGWRTWSANGEERLDSTYPYYPNPVDASFSVTGFKREAADTPFLPHDEPDLPPSTTELRVGDERFSTWVMFKPTGESAAWVPLESFAWRWGGRIEKADAGGGWGPAVATHASYVDPAMTHEHPVWTSSTRKFEGDFAADWVAASNVLGLVLDDATQEEGAGQVQGRATVHLSQAAEGHIEVRLRSSEPSRLRVPDQVVIADGQSSVAFDYEIVDDAITNSSSPVAVGAFRDGYVSAADTIEIIDDEAQ